MLKAHFNTDSIRRSLENMETGLEMGLARLCAEIGQEAEEKLVERQDKNEFWNNQTYRAIEAIDHDTEDTGDEIEISVGFVKGEPMEEDRAREYGQYLAEYMKKGNNGNHFLGGALEELVKAMLRRVPDIEEYLTSKATYKNGEWEQA